MLNDIRKDYLLDRWVVIATHRGRRPTDFTRKKTTTSRRDSSCPFCPGNERKTPPAVLVYLKGDGGIIKKADTNGTRHQGWLIRCVPNLYSAFSPPERGESFKALANGQIQLEKMVELGEAITNRNLQRSSEEEITVVDLTGVAIQDIQIAKAVWKAIKGEL